MAQEIKPLPDSTMLNRSESTPEADCVLVADSTSMADSTPEVHLEIIERPFVVSKSDAVDSWLEANLETQHANAWRTANNRGQHPSTAKVAVIKLVHRSVKTFLRRDTPKYSAHVLCFPPTNHEALITEISIRYLQNILPHFTLRDPCPTDEFSSLRDFSQKMEYSFCIDGKSYDIMHTDLFPFSFFAIDRIFYYAGQQVIEKDLVSDVFPH